ncbi:hypothetical protein AWR36_014505 [Microbulbifer flavimaris]|uniref:Uncharacterized protein n=1 Tax=Microbulbifer flavimaris TaxID=1781068 RepID=A0ABX4HX67_9GAMM|nr:MULTISPECIES: hypothetical protein [Microbulbifer]KUJ80219.1 hypothetical protein AVO43_14460 [Microbulbifer sp. ZGT114]PCO04285.1 hypothetical protein AWR36_014505 [Microbulbifer flavimaris]
MNSHSLPLQRALCFLCLLFICGNSNAKTHPSYLTPAYCDGLVEQFVDSGMRSLGTYVNEHFNPEYRGGIRNTIHFLDQRIEWLNECNDYLLDTNKSTVFYSEKLTRDIFAAIQALSRELQHVRQGVEYPDDTGANNPAPFIKERYVELAELVDQHHTRMLMKKQFQ